MSNEAVKWAMDDAPMLRTDKDKPDATARHVLQVLAEHARPDGTNSHPSVLRIQYRTGYDRTTVQRALRRLEKGALIVKDGTTEGRSRWKLNMTQRRPATDWADLEREEDLDRAAATERKRRSRAKQVTHTESVTVTGAEYGTVTDAESVTDPMSRTQSTAVTDFKYGRHALSAALTTNNRQTTNYVNNSSSAPAALDETDDLFDSLAAKSAAIHEQRGGEDLSKFLAFWTAYPKKRDREEAVKEYRAAIGRGADPEHITAGAKRYAEERKGKDPQYTKLPATWLRKGCYDDEPDPEPTANDGYQPFRNPTNQDDYDQPFWSD